MEQDQSLINRAGNLEFVNSQMEQDLVGNLESVRSQLEQDPCCHDGNLESVRS